MGFILNYTLYNWLCQIWVIKIKIHYKKITCLVKTTWDYYDFDNESMFNDLNQYKYTTFWYADNKLRISLKFILNLSLFMSHFRPFQFGNCRFFRYTCAFYWIILQPSYLCKLFKVWIQQWYRTSPKIENRAFLQFFKHFTGLHSFLRKFHGENKHYFYK